MNKMMQRVRSVVPILVIPIIASGCVATLNEKYYLLASDPKTGVSNYYRVHLSGSVYASQAKYSVGLYDREAVQQLFGESALQREFIATRLRVFAETDKDLAELDSALSRLEQNLTAVRKQQLTVAYGSASGSVEQIRIALEMEGEIAGQFQSAITRAETLRSQAGTHLEQDKLTEALGDLRQLQAILTAIRNAVDADVVVRFFDGDGNERDVANKSEVVFVATDVSRFTEALRQLAESKEASENILRIVMRDDIQRAATLKRTLDREEAQGAAVDAYLGGLGLDENSDLQATIKAIQLAAGAIGGSTRPLSTAEAISAYAEGLEAGQ